MKKHMNTVIQIIVICLLTLTLTVIIPNAAALKANPAKTCTAQAYGGKTLIQIGEDGYALQLVPLPVPVCGPYVVIANPQGSGSQEAVAGAEPIASEFAAERWFVDTFLDDAFVIGVKGEPGAGVWFQWAVVPEVGE